MANNVYLENQVVRVLELQDEIKRMQENLERLKAQIAEEMEASMVNELTVPLDELFDVKVKLTERTTKKIDKEELAQDLGVPVTSINIKFLIKAVEDRRLSYQRFLDYIYQNTTENVSVRKVKAKGRKQ
jgi:hypothetical protein